MQLPAGGRGSRPSPIAGNTGTPSMRRSRAEPKFASTSTPIVASASGTRRLDEPMPPFQPNATMPVPAPTHPCSTTPPRASATARAASAASTCTIARVVQPAVVALADDRDHDVVDADPGVGLAGDGHGTVEDASDGHRRGEIDRRLDQAPLGDLEEAGQLPGAVEGSDAGRHRAAERGRPGAGQDRRDARCARSHVPRAVPARHARPSRDRRGRPRRR